ncbi:MAG: discoidin domain-containing protein [Bacteroidota bacterium]|nr:discoidin domain-containing protein [Bacteroidota bacterium]
MMKKFTRYASLCLCFFLHIGPGYSQTDVLTQHNDLNRTGWNPTETILNQSNVTPTNFGLLYKRTVDDQIYAQPLIVSGVTIGGVKKNVVYVATVKNTIYAFDADDGTLDPYWTRNFTPAGETVPNAGDVHASLCGFGYTDFQAVYGLGQAGSFGIVGTPVIDKSTNTLYFVSRYRDLTVDNTLQGSNGHFDDPDWSSAGFYQQFHAIDLSTGADKFNSPVTITAQVNGTGEGGTVIQFDPRRENQRGGLTLSNGIVYIAYSGHCDMNNYHGWILGYNAADLTDQKIRYVTTPNDGRGGIWMSGAGLAADSSGNLYFSSGNGSSGSNSGDPGNVALSVVKVTPDLTNHTLTNVSWFKRTTYDGDNQSDLDFGTGVVLIPGSNMLVTAHKSGIIYLLKQNIPAPGGEYHEASPNFLSSYDLGVGSSAQGHSSLTYFGGVPTQYIYQFSEYTHIKAFPVNAAGQTLGTPISNTSVPTNINLDGGYMSVSSNGTDPSSAILWVSHLTGSGGALHALKANDITQELWNSDANPNDLLGRYAKMTCVSVANGKVYAPTFTNSLNVYGLLAANTRCVNNVALNKTVTASSSDPNFPASNITDGNPPGTPSTRWAISAFTHPQFAYVDLGQRYDICKVQIYWNNINDFAQDFTVDISDDAVNWTTINTVTGNSFAGSPFLNEFNEHSTGRYVRMNATGFASLSIAEMLVFGSPASNCVPPALANMTVTNITQNSATLNWKPVTGITDYIVKYRGPTVSSYITRHVQDLSGSGNTLSMNIAGLTCGFTYEFDAQSDCGSGVVSAPSVQLFTALNCSSPCTNLTRFYHGDLGDIQTAGMSCYNSPTFTVSGAGTGIGGNGDQFQFNYTSLDKDEEFIVHVATQDQVGPSNKNLAGIMMRDSVTDISRFIFIGKTGDNNLSLMYRPVTGGAAVSSAIPNSSNANYFRIVKAGTTYSAFYGNSSAGPWTQMGTIQDLGFGTQTIYIGMAVSSLNSTTLSTATFDNLLENSTNLPVQLLNFTAVNVQNQYISLTWQTATEENNDHFDVERSTDGITFTKIATVKAVGNSSTLQSYSAADNDPAPGMDFYRLKQVDSDGHFVYSSVDSVKFGSGDGPLVYPNPVHTVITAVPGTDLIREIVIYNVQGRAVQFAMGNSTLEEMKVNVYALPAGVYILKVKTDPKIYQFKIIKD